MGEPATPQQLFARLDQLGIAHRSVEHPPLRTVEEAKALRGELPGAHIKNLFLRNKREEMWLVVALEDRPIDLKALAQKLDAGRFSFGSPERLMRHLGILPGAVSPLALINDAEHKVRPVIDREILAYPLVNAHPLRNTQTTALGPADLLRFIESLGHHPTLIDLGG